MTTYTKMFLAKHGYKCHCFGENGWTDFFGAIFTCILILLQNKLWMNEIHTQNKV